MALEQDVSDAVIALMFILSLVTIIGNTLTIIVIITKKSLRNNPGNRFLLSLSIADCFVGLFVMIPSAFKAWVSKHLIVF